MTTNTTPFENPRPSRHIEALAALGVPRYFRRGALLIQEGDFSDSLYIVQQGCLRSFLANNSGKELTLGLHGPQEYVGEMALDGGPRSAHVEALEPTRCSVVSRATVLTYLLAEPEFSMELLARVIRRARLATESARSVALVDVYGRLVQLLNQIAGTCDSSGKRRMQQRLTHQAIARHLACSREMVSRLLKDLENGGYLEVRDRWIWLLKPLPARW